MRILFVAPHPPHPTQGGAAIRNWHLIRAAECGGHQVHLLTFGPLQNPVPVATADVVDTPSARSRSRRFGDAVVRPQPDLMMRLGASTLRSHLSGIVKSRQIELIQVEGLEMWPSVRAVQIPTIYDAHNAETALQRGMARQAFRDRDLGRALYSTVQSRKLARYEAAAMREAATTLAVSETDAATLRALAPSARVDVVPIGVDTAHFAPDAPKIAASERFDVVFSGTMDYRANEDAALWMATKVWPRVRQRSHGATLAIVGRNPTERITLLGGQDGITVTGEVADDRSYMAGAGIYALPIRFGAGVRVKLLNALSMGCAVVATPVACEGIAIADGDHAIVADADPVAFAEAIVGLLSNAARRSQLGIVGRELMRAQYDWSHVIPRLLAVYERLGGAHG